MLMCCAMDLDVSFVFLLTAITGANWWPRRSREMFRIHKWNLWKSTKIFNSYIVVRGVIVNIICFINTQLFCCLVFFAAFLFLVRTCFINFVLVLSDVVFFTENKYFVFGLISSFEWKVLLDNMLCTVTLLFDFTRDKGWREIYWQFGKSWNDLSAYKCCLKLVFCTGFVEWIFNTVIWCIVCNMCA